MKTKHWFGISRKRLIRALSVSMTLVLAGCGGASYSDTTSTGGGAAVVSSFAPTTAVAGVATTYLVTGTNLPSTVTVTLTDGSCATPTNVTATSFSVVCTSGSTVGYKSMIAYNDRQSNGGWWIGQQTLAVTAAPSAQSLLADTGITANQCYAAGSNALFSCTGVDAIALNDKQDGMVGRDVTNPDSSDGLLGSSYRLVGAVGATDCVKDEVTGKTWQRASSTLTALPGDAMNQQAVGMRDAANAAALCGYTDWTIPSPSDLQSLVNYGVGSGLAAIDGNWFTARSAWYFTLTQYLSGSSRNVWLVDFTRGQVNGIGALAGSAEQSCGSMNRSTANCE